MTWAKLDDGFYRHPKARAAGKDGRALFTAGLCWAASHLTDGFIATTDLGLIAAEAEVRPAATARRLVDVGMWETAAGGWQIHDYLDFNPTAEHERDKRRKRAEAGRKGGLRSRPPGSKTEANASANGEAEWKRNRTPSPSLENTSSFSGNSREPQPPGAASAAQKTTNDPTTNDPAPTEYQPTVALPAVAEGLEPHHLWPEMARRQHFLRCEQGERPPPLTSTRGHRWLTATADGYRDQHHLQAQAVIATTIPGTDADAVIWELEPALALRDWAQPTTPPPPAEAPIDVDPEALAAARAEARAALHTRNGSQPTREDNDGHVPDEAR